MCATRWLISGHNFSAMPLTLEKNQTASRKKPFLVSKLGAIKDHFYAQLTQTGQLRPPAAQNPVSRAVPHLQFSLTSDINFVAFIQAEQGLDSASADMDSVCCEERQKSSHCLVAAPVSHTTQLSCI